VRFVEVGAGLRHDLRDAEAAADLDELAAGDDDLVLPRKDQRRQRQEQRRGVVVHGDGRLGAGDAPQQPFYVLVAAAALAGGEVELEVAVAVAHGRHRGDGLVRQGRAAEVGVDDDAGGVDDGPQAGAQRGVGAGGRRLGDGFERRVAILAACFDKLRANGA